MAEQENVMKNKNQDQNLNSDIKRNPADTSKDQKQGQTNANRPQGQDKNQQRDRK